MTTHDARLIREAKATITAQGDFEEVVQLFFDAGVCKRVAGRLLSECAEISLRDARRLVHHSKAFRGQKEADENLEAEFFDDLESIGFIPTDND